MGGKALGFDTVRLLKSDFLSIQDEVVTILKQRFDTVLPTVWYNTKESFGDLDLIVGRPVPEDILQWLTITFNSKKVVYNGESLDNAVAISFDYKDFQIDLIFVHPDNLQIAHFYYSYNDLNNYVGRVAAQFGMKFGFNGLYYETAEEDILISKDAAKIYTFLGFNYEMYKEGFETLEDTFSYVIFSKYFNSNIYQYENLNNINRSRNAKRPNYQKFLDFLVANNINGGYTYPDRETAIQMIDAFFNVNLAWKLNMQQVLKLRQEKIKETFNSKIIKDFIQIEDWTLVRRIVDQIYTIENVDAYLASLKEDEIKELIFAALEKQKEEQSFKENDVVIFRSNDNKHIKAIVLTELSEYVKLQTEDLYIYRIKKDRVRFAENWYDFKKVKTLA